MKHYIIIGNGVAAVGCIEGIRSVDKDAAVTVVSEENRAVYCRPLISYYLEGKTDLDRMKYRPDDFYALNGCNVLYGKKAVSINKNEKNVVLDDGSVLEYDSLCVASGSSPFVPPIKGLETVKNSFSFMTVDDTLALENAINSEADVLIVGAGLIGLKCAEGLSGRVKSITVCDLADRVLSSILDNECARLMQSHLEKNGIKFMLSDTVTEFDENKAYMKSGNEVKFDVLVMAVGVRANVELVRNIEGEVGRDIVVDTKMQTSVENIYAAGDCTEGEDFSFGKKRVLAILPNAYMQGHCAGVNMADGNEVFDNAIPMNSIGFFGLHAMTAGSYFGADEGGELFEEKTEDAIRRFYVRDGYLTGYILIGEVERAGIYTSLIRKKIPLDTLDFEALKKVTDFSAFSAENRRKMFGGVV